MDSQVVDDAVYTPPLLRQRCPSIEHVSQIHDVALNLASTPLPDTRLSCSSCSIAVKQAAGYECQTAARDGMPTMA